MLSSFKQWFSVLDEMATAVVQYSRRLNTYRSESYLDLDELSNGE